MKLSMIYEVQFKEIDTNLERSNSAGSLAVNSINNLYKKKRTKKKNGK